MHNSKQPFSFLRTSRAPQNKTANIDFFFKKDPRLNALGSTKKQTSGDKYYEAACKGQGISGANLKYHSYYQRQIDSDVLLQPESSTISETYQQILNLKMSIDKAEENSIFISPTQLLDESIIITNAENGQV